VDVELAIRTRRTHKAFGAEAVPRAVLDELLELACWAPNHRLTNPWRFRVLGPAALERLKAAAGPQAATKLARAPTLIAVTSLADSDPIVAQENAWATACAVYAVLLGAHNRGLAGYWRTPAVLRTAAGRAALGITAQEIFLALVHLGWPRQHRDPPPRLPAETVVSYLD
jgi:nitroreductase